MERMCSRAFLFEGILEDEENDGEDVQDGPLSAMFTKDDSNDDDSE